MRYARARLQHQAGEAADGDLHAHALLVDEYEGAVGDLELAVAQEDDASPLLEHDRTEGNIGGIGHGGRLTRDG